MKASIIAVLSTFAAAALAAPAGDHVRRNLQDRGHNVNAQTLGSTAYGPTPTGASPSGVLPPAGPQPTGIVPPAQPVPSGVLPPPGAVPTGSSSLPACSVDGAIVCNGPNQFGICNWGHVFLMDVADGTACVDGKIVGTGAYATSAPTPTS